MESYQFFSDFHNRADLAQYGDNALLLYALELKYQLEDIHSVAAESLIDGGGDKNCDLVYISDTYREIVIAQGYFCRKESKPDAAPSSKASGLNNAVAWLFCRPTHELPENIRPVATAIRDNLDNIETIKIWYVHNLSESKNVSDELKTVEHATIAMLHEYIQNHAFSVEALEIGCKTLQEWYNNSVATILVSKEFDIEVAGGYSVSGNDWSAFVTAVSGKWLYNLYREYKDELYSANVRGYIGIRRSERNINNQIQRTAQDDPIHFWVYNNGLTALVHNFEVKQIGDKTFLHIQGISIVNGAQTTGCIGTLSTPPKDDLTVPIRFVRCTDKTTIENVIKYNNTQNQILASDFRSNDPVQRRLREEFRRKFPDITYFGGRRDHSNKRAQIPSDSAAMSLTAFHMDPVTAYHEKGEIWEKGSYYEKVFNEKTTAEHIIFVFSLLRTIEDKKHDLSEKYSSGTIMDTEKKQLEFLRYRGAIYVLLYAIGSCLETLLNQAVPNKFRLAFKRNLPLEDCKRHWRLVVDAVMPFSMYLMDYVKHGAKSKEALQPAVNQFRSMVESVASVNPSMFHGFREHVNI